MVICVAEGLFGIISLLSFIWTYEQPDTTTTILPHQHQHGVILPHQHQQGVILVGKECGKRKEIRSSLLFGGGGIYSIPCCASYFASVDLSE